MSLPPTIGRFRIVGLLGQGAMGVVYRGRDETLDREVAVKVMAPGPEADQDSRDRFQREARAAARLQHPNIVTVYELGEHEGRLYMVLELLEGLDLQRAIEAGLRPDFRLNAPIVLQVLAGLADAHEHGIVHRDVKPSNVFLLRERPAKIMDFGVARLAGGATRTGLVMGTPNYMSPEQVKGGPLDGRSDLFSVGLILYELVTGEKAYRAPSVVSLLFKIAHEPPDLSLLPRGARWEGLRRVVVRALARNPTERFPDARSMGSELEQVLLELGGASDWARFTAATLGLRLPSGVPALAPTIVTEPTFPIHHAPTEALPRPGGEAGRGVPTGATACTSPPAVTSGSPSRPDRSPLRPSALETRAGGHGARGTAMRAPTPEPAPRRRSPAVFVASTAGALGLAAGAVVLVRLSDAPAPARLSAESGGPAPTMAAVPASAAPPTASAWAAGPLGPPLSAGPASAPSAPTAAPASRSAIPAAPTAAATARPDRETSSPAPRAGDAAVASAEAPDAPGEASEEIRDIHERPAPVAADEARLERANDLFEKGRFAAAMAEARGVLARDPRNASARALAEDVEAAIVVEVRLRNARAALKRQDPDAALAEVRAGLAVAPSDGRLLTLFRELTQ